MGWLVDEWAFLCRELIPMVRTAARKGLFSAAVCGSPRNATSLALALSTVSGEDGAFEVFLCPSPSYSDPVGFTPVEMIRLARQVGSADLDRDGRRALPSRKLLDRVVVGAPDRPVDLVVVEAGPVRPCLKSVLDRLRTGGQVFTQGGSAADRLDPSEFRLLDPEGRLAERISGPGSPVSCPGPARPTLAQIVAQAELIKSHYPLARGMARRYCRVEGELADLEQVAFTALVRAAGRYDPEQHPAFTPFAARSVSGEIKRYFRDKTWVMRVPRSLQEAYLQVRAARDELAQDLGASPTVAQIADRLNTTEETVLAAMEAGANYRAASLDSTGREDDGGKGRVPSVDSAFDLRLDLQALAGALPALEGPQQLVVKRVFFDGRTQREVAGELGVSQMQVSRLLARALVSLRRALGGRGL